MGSSCCGSREGKEFAPPEKSVYECEIVDIPENSCKIVEYSVDTTLNSKIYEDISLE